MTGRGDTGSPSRKAAPCNDNEQGLLCSVSIKRCQSLAGLPNLVMVVRGQHADLGGPLFCLTTVSKTPNPDMSFVAIQFLTGLSGSVSLFLTSAGLTVIFGVTRVVNFAHGSLFMLGAYIGWTILTRLPHDPLWFVAGVIAAAMTVAAIGAALETTLLRRLYHAPELFQLLATFGVMLVIQDTILLIWGPNDLPLPRALWLRGYVTILDARFPLYDLILIGIGPIVLAAMSLLLASTRFGMMIRACTENRDMAAALGIDQRRLSTMIFALGAGLAGLGGALILPDTSANTQMDLAVIVEAFVVVVVGGMGSVGGAFLASLLIGELQAFGIVLIPKATLVLVFVIMAAVLSIKPSGLLGGSPLVTMQQTGRTLFRPPSRTLVWLGCGVIALTATTPFWLPPYWLSVLTEAMIAAMFACGLHLMMGPGGMISFGHAAWFGLGAYGSALALKTLAAPMPLALLAAPVVAGSIAAVFGWFVVRLSGVYLAMLTLAFAQIVWAVATQWTWLTGGDDGILGVWPSGPVPFFWWALMLTSTVIWLHQRVIRSPFGLALRGARDSESRTMAIGLRPERLRMVAFALSGAAAGLSGGLFAFKTGSVFPAYAAVGRSVDGLLMVLLGGIDTGIGPIVGAIAYTGLYDLLLQTVPLWRMALGLTIIALVLLFPDGLAGTRRRS
jgi:branched-chain amino acid transport system permease protein